MDGTPNETTPERQAFAALPDLITPAELQLWLGLSRGGVYEGIRRGVIPSVRVGRRLFIPKARLARLLGLDNTDQAEGSEANGNEIDGDEARSDGGDAA